MKKKTPSRGRPRSAGPPRIPKQVKFHPNIYGLIVAMCQREQRRSTRSISRQEIIEKAVVTYAHAYHPTLIKNNVKEAAPA